MILELLEDMTKAALFPRGHRSLQQVRTGLQGSFCWLQQAQTPEARLHRLLFPTNQDGPGVYAGIFGSVVSCGRHVRYRNRISTLIHLSAAGYSFGGVAARKLREKVSLAVKHK